MSRMRQPKGVPVGGQFSAGARAEADVSLMGPGSAPAREGDGLAGADRAEVDGAMIEARQAAAEANRALANESARSLARTILARHPNAAYVELVDSDEEYGRVRIGELLDADGEPINDPVMSSVWRDGDPMAGTLPEQMVENLDLADIDADWRQHVQTPDLEDSTARLDLRAAASRGSGRGWVQDLTSAGPPSEPEMLRAQQMALDAQVQRLKNRNDMLVLSEMSQRIRAADPRIAYVDVTIDDEDRDRLWPTRMCDADGEPYDAANGGVGEPGIWEVEEPNRPYMSSAIQSLQLHGFGTWDRYAAEVDGGGGYGSPTWRIDLKAAASAHQERL